MLRRSLLAAVAVTLMAGASLADDVTVMQDVKQAGDSALAAALEDGSSNPNDVSVLPLVGSEAKPTGEQAQELGFFRHRWHRYSHYYPYYGRYYYSYYYPSYYYPGYYYYPRFYSSYGCWW